MGKGTNFGSYWTQPRVCWRNFFKELARTGIERCTYRFPFMLVSTQLLLLEFQTISTKVKWGVKKEKRRKDRTEQGKQIS
jgi:hypothetical protein